MNAPHNPAEFMENVTVLAMVVLFSTSVAILVIAVLRLVRGESAAPDELDMATDAGGEAEGAAPARPRRGKAPWSGARAPRHAEPPPSRPNSAEIADVERRFATAFSTVPPHRREHLIAHALLRLGTAYRTKAMVHLLDEKARCR